MVPAVVNYDAFRTLRDDWGVNVIRLAMYTQEYGGYCNGGDREGLKQLIDNGVFICITAWNVCDYRLAYFK